MKIPALLIISFFISSLAFCQKDLVVKSGSKGLYLEHKVAAKENFFSIGRLYNTHPRTLAAYNSLQLDKGLNLGQIIRIPLNDTNFDQASGIGVPVYYVPAAQESYSSISDKHNKLPIARMILWNDRPDKNVVAGEMIIIGFLNTKEFQSQAVDYSNRKSTAANDKPLPSKPDDKPAKAETLPELKEDSKKQEVITVRNDVNAANGFFKSDFDRQIRRFPLSKEQMVTSGIFKTTSGWQDAKYYILIDKVEPGTIIRITNPINNKAVYAKVLYGMEGIRQNEGLDIRISNAAASILGITDTEKFFVKINY